MKKSHYSQHKQLQHPTSSSFLCGVTQRRLVESYWQPKQIISL